MRGRGSGGISRSEGGIVWEGRREGRERKNKREYFRVYLYLSFHELASLVPVVFQGIQCFGSISRLLSTRSLEIRLIKKKNVPKAHCSWFHQLSLCFKLLMILVQF